MLNLFGRNTWVFFAVIHIIAFVTYNQAYRYIAKKVRSNSVAAFTLYFFAGISILPFIFFFPLRFYPLDPLLFFPLLLNMFVLYAFESNRTTTVRRELDTSTVSVLYQTTTIFLVMYDLLLFNKHLTPEKIAGVLLIIFANVVVLYERKLRLNRYTILAIACAFSYGTALAIDTLIGQQINYAVYSASTFIVPAFFNAINSALVPSDITKYFNNKKIIIIMGICCIASAQLFFSGVLALQTATREGLFTTAAALMSTYNILNALIEHIVFKFDKRFVKKLIAAVVAVAGVYFALH